MEDPGYPRARAAFLSAALRIVPVPVDPQGIVVSAGKRREHFPKLIYVTPSFQCPLGCMMSLGRRFELLRAADEADAWIIEDDYFSEYRFGSGPVASLQSVDPAQRVIYIGNFSKSIAPSLRIGYVVLPTALVDAFTRVRTTISRQPTGVDQAILAEFISAGHLERHIRTTLGVYRERQRILVDAIRNYGKGILETNPTGTGMYLIAWLKPGIDDRVAATVAASHGVDVVPLSTFSVKPLRRTGLLLGYSAYGGDSIRSAVKNLSAALSSCKLIGKIGQTPA
jgi:GntR family transcriptional regulator/MocR family aminotransferase